VIHDTPNSNNDTDEGAVREHAGAESPGFADGAEDSSVPVEPAPEPVHRWLDGERVDQADLDSPDAKRHVEFWAKMNRETERRRRMATPRGLDAVIMEKLEPPVAQDD
jgi:hypothetical protein